MRKIWLTVLGLWLLSVVYFVVYVNAPSLRTLVDTSAVWGGVHIAADLILFAGGLALILHLISRLRRH
ncbi:hypothetical protein [Lacticaseibacillus sp. GG6-2]